MKTITGHITPDWLNHILSVFGYLPPGQVCLVAVEDQPINRGFVSEIVRLHVTYDREVTSRLPTGLLLKRPRSDIHPELRGLSSHEANFYEASARLGIDLPIPICYGAAYDQETGESYILMEDLSATHFQRPLPIPPSFPYCTQTIENLARLHATFWNSQLLGCEMGERLTVEQAALMNQRLVDTTPAFFDFIGDALLEWQRRALEKILASDFLDRLSRRLCVLENVTIIHGDAHTGNLLLPRDSRQHRIVRIDWQLWNINVPTVDLAFLMALHWPTQRRAEFELPLLRHYHRRLGAMGVTDYGWDELWHDYRESVMIMCLIPIGQFRRGRLAGVVWHGLQDSLAAFQDLDCEELL